MNKLKVFISGVQTEFAEERQKMLFCNRLEVWNPGQLPYHLTIPKLEKPYGSSPANPLLAESLYLARYIERKGTGILDMIKVWLIAGMKESKLIHRESYKTILWRKVNATPQVTRQATGQAQRLILVLEKEMSRQELMNILDLKHNQTFRENYLYPLLEGELVEMTIPENPTDPNQKYRLTAKGKALQQQLKKKK